MKLSWIARHFVRVLKHKSYLLKSGRDLKVSYYRILIHDLSKFSWQEIKAYSRQFYAPKEERNYTEFKSGWHHHVVNNPHHWEYWVLSGRDHEWPLEMPEKFAREMVADWYAASKAYTGSWDMQSWLHKNWATIKMHPKTRAFVLELLKGKGVKYWLLPMVEE